MIVAPVYASTYIENEKPVGVKKEIFVKVLSDLRNFKEIFPAFIKSVELKPDSNLAKFTIEAGGTHQADARSSFQPDGKYIVEILSGDLKGTKFIISLTERVGFNGTPNGATTVKTQLFLESSGMASVALIFYGNDEISTAIGDGMYNLGEYAKRKYPISQNQNDIVQKEKSTSQIKSEKKAAAKELGTVKKTDLKKEAAQKLDLKKEAEKKLKQKESSAYTGYQGISKESKSTLEKQLKLAKEKVKKTEEKSSPSIKISTDKTSYRYDDLIIVKGFVKNYESGRINLRILDSNSKLIQIDQFTPATDGSFSRTYVAAGPLWEARGNYIIIVQYGSTQQADTNFVFRH